MKRIFSSLNIAEVGLLRSLLEAQGMVAIVKNQHTSIAVGSLGFLDAIPELWVRAEDFERAEAFVREWRRGGNSDPLEAWRCSDCAEHNEGQFGECWNCGQSAPEI